MSRFFENSNMVTAEDEAAVADASKALQGGDAAAPGDSPAADAQRVAAEQPQGVQVPENVQKLREGQMYDAAKTFAQEIRIENPELPPEQVEAANVELRRMAGDVGLSSPEVKEIAQIAKANFANPPTDETQDTWRTEATNALSRQYGAKAHEAITLAQKLYQRDPRLAAFLEANGLGNHPRVVAAMVQRAYAERKRGRL